MNRSESIKEIAPAVVEFQSEVKDPVKGANNKYFDSQYVDLGGLLDAIRPVLTKFGLSVMQFPKVDGRAVSVTTLLLHKSGEWIESDPFTLTTFKADPQAIGSAVTYGRRYSLSSILGVAWDADDDGNIASNRVEQARNEQKKQTKENTRREEKKAVQTKPEPKTVEDYYQLTIEWARDNKAVTFVGPLLSQNFKKQRFEDLTLNEAKAFYKNLPGLVKRAMKKDDDVLMEGVG